MLQTLRVKNLALVKNVEVQFESGLNVITGETGAGKSILVGALGLLLGERADKSLIRAGEDSYGVEAVFFLAEPSEIDSVLDQAGLDACRDGQLIVRRIVSAEGTSRNFVNGSPATLQILKKLGDLLVDMHGPHDHQSLLNPSFQMDLLDAFGHCWKERADYETTYDETCVIRRRRTSLAGNAEDIRNRMDLLQFQVKELEEAKLDPNDEQEMLREHRLVANAQTIAERGAAALHGLTEGESSAFNSLTDTQRALEELTPLLDDSTAWSEEARSIAIQIQELANTLSGAISNIETDPTRLQWIEDRMALYAGLKRKYGKSVEEMLESLDRAREQLADLETRDEQLAALQKELAAAEETARKKGQALRAKRSDAAQRLAADIAAALADLGLEHAGFSVDLAPADPGPSGIDSVEFGFAPNVGEPMRPLRTIASSGEISRVMLAVKAVLAAHDKIPILVFDEIDANLGGEMGTAVGQKLATVADGHQVLCITHLPQVAAFADTHFSVAKEVVKGRTSTTITPLDHAARVEEIARMLGGRKRTTVTVDHARELLTSARSSRGPAERAPVPSCPELP